MVTLSLHNCFEVGIASLAYDLEKEPEHVTGYRAQIIVPQIGRPPLVFAALLGAGFWVFKTMATWRITVRVNHRAALRSTIRLNHHANSRLLIG